MNCRLGFLGAGVGSLFSLENVDKTEKSCLLPVVDGEGPLLNFVDEVAVV